jgi:transposase
MYDIFFVNRVLKIYNISGFTIYEWKNIPVNIVEYVVKNKTINCDKIYDIVKNKFNKNISRRTVYDVLKKNNITYKKCK